MKTNLHDLSNAEKAFFGEYNTYSTDLVSISWMPEGSPAYTYGFCGEFPTEPMSYLPNHDPKRNHTMHPKVIGSPPGYSTASMKVADACAALGKLGLADKFTANGQTFRIFAVGNIDSDADLDVWSVDNIKSVDHLKKD